MADSVVIINSESEEEDDQYDLKLDQNESFNLTLQKLRNNVGGILFSNTTNRIIFPYKKFEELLNDFKIELLKTFDKRLVPRRQFLWKIILQWILAIKKAYSGDLIDLKDDLKFNLMLTDIMAEFVTFKCNATLMMNKQSDYANVANFIIMTLSLIFNNNRTFIQLTMLKVEIRYDFREILIPVFTTFLSRRVEHPKHPVNLITYLRIIFYCRLWKMLYYAKEDKEKINEMAVGAQKQNDGILPKYVPSIDDASKMFLSISDLIRFAMQKGNIGTRTLLINKTMNIEEAIEKYFVQYKRYINRIDARACISEENLMQNTFSRWRVLNTIKIFI